MPLVELKCRFCQRSFALERWRARESAGLCSRACVYKAQNVDERARFWPKVKKTRGCWLWIGAPGYAGYGAFRDRDGKRSGAHRVAWRLTNGEIKRGLMVLHKCDNPACVRPSHLFLGTQLDNMRDAKAKGKPLGRWIHRSGRIR